MTVTLLDGDAPPPELAAPRQGNGDLVITVCDLAQEELGSQAAIHWSVPDPVPAGDPAGFDLAVDGLAFRVARLAPRLRAGAARLPDQDRLARRPGPPG